MSLIQRKILGMVFRQGLMLLSGFLIARGYISQDDWGVIAGTIDIETLVGLVAAGATVYAGAKNKQRDVAVVEKAIDAPPSMTVEQVEQSVPAAVFPRLSSANR